MQQCWLSCCPVDEIMLELHHRLLTPLALIIVCWLHCLLRCLLGSLVFCNTVMEKHLKLLLTSLFSQSVTQLQLNHFCLKMMDYFGDASELSLLPPWSPILWYCQCEQLPVQLRDYSDYWCVEQHVTCVLYSTMLISPTRAMTELIANSWTT